MECRLLSQATIQEASCVFVFTALECYIKISHLHIIVYRTDLLVDLKFVKSYGDEWNKETNSRRRFVISHVKL